jgi:hypothetical protein
MSLGIPHAQLLFSFRNHNILLVLLRRGLLGEAASALPHALKSDRSFIMTARMIQARCCDRLSSWMSVHFFVPIGRAYD